jgi:predicted dehydrogenase
LVLMVGHTFEFSPPIRELRNLIDGGVLGEIRYINSARATLTWFGTSRLMTSRS